MSPWVSTSVGYYRYKTAYRYGRGRSRNIKTTNSNEKRQFIILDYWELACEENYSFRNANYVGNKLRKMGIPWHPNKDNEVMVKYALFPHQLIGYYYFEDDDLKYYFINQHYLREWKENINFNIGDHVYIDQVNVDFPSNNPYKIIYSKNGRSFSVFNRWL